MEEGRGKRKEAKNPKGPGGSGYDNPRLLLTTIEYLILALEGHPLILGYKSV